MIRDLIIGVGFLGVAYLLLALTFLFSSRLAKIILIVIGVLFLMLQGGCCIALENFGRAFGGGAEHWVIVTTIIGAVGFVLFSVLLLYTRIIRPTKNNDGKSLSKFS